jgi:hypothetical protein
MAQHVLLGSLGIYLRVAVRVALGAHVSATKASARRDADKYIKPSISVRTVVCIRC